MTNLPTFDFDSIFTDSKHTNRKPEHNRTIIDEDVALGKELTYHIPTVVGIDELGNPIKDRPRYWGFDVQTADYEKLISYFSDKKVTKRSDALISYVLRKCAVRFPVEFARDKKKLHTQIKKYNPLFNLKEFELIESHATNDPEFFGRASLQNNQLFNGKLNNRRSKIVKQRNGKFTVIRI